MDINLHSADELDNLQSRRLVLIDGIACHRWPDGFTLPVLRGAAGDDDGGGGDDDASGGDDDEGDDDDDGDGSTKTKAKKDDDEDEDDKPTDLKKAAARIHKLSQESAKHRIRLKTERAEHATTRADRDALKVRLEKLEKDGVTDDGTKKKLADYETELAELRKYKSETEGREKQVALEADVQAALDDLEIDIEADVMISRLRKMGIKPNEDNEIDDLERTLKRLLKEKKLKKKSASGDDEDDDDDTSGGASRSGRSVNGRANKNKGAANAVALAKRFPALRH